ncbi:hypothetical protein QBC33DRAFT_467785 [Phialemonium atrogriseum]|uniref:DNA polymerase lambda n=1 Tax=Phialemonium atrogriseum TaxID=1093897 RepID=A0AAJ0C3K2_9PEZI|nr:uncharacterized protein QBC33DRAFT_467785 [Phialemonium atrogriseum]KAK1769508.1 hypothetical protein QBC33DRAFT_467785 [Phialemonium atrogriseum]
MSSHSLTEKVQFFNQLDALSEPDTDGEDDSNDVEEWHRKRCRAFFKPRRKASSPFPRPGMPKERETPSASRTQASPALGIAATQAKVIEGTPILGNSGQSRNRGTGASFIEETPIPDSSKTVHPALHRSSTNPLPTHSTHPENSPSSNPTMRKRKRNSSASAKSVPESDKIFRDLSFYYIPNNDVAPARKIRIAKAQEYGAQWIRTLDGATHAVVDKNLTYKDVEKILESTASSLVIVNEDYPIDSISFRTLLNPCQHRYRVTGCPLLTAAPASSPAEVQQPLEDSGGSLPLKDVQRNPKRDRDAALGGTPPRSGQSSLGGVEKELLGGKPSEGLATLSSGSKQPGGSSGDEPPQDPESAEFQKPVEGGRMAKDSVNDELTEYISLIQQYKDLPLDEDNDEVQSLQDTNGSASDSDSSSSSKPAYSSSRKPRAHKSTTTAEKSIPFAEHFACNRGGTKDGSEASAKPNARTIEVLQSMCDYYTRINDHWRTTAYRKAISTLRRQTVKIATEEEAYRLPAIGRRLAQKIEEIVQTNRLRRLEYAQGEPLDRVLELFLGIYDVGVSRASKWVAQGFRTLDDLRQRADLTPNQRLGLERYDDLNTRIPRAEVDALAGHVRAAAVEIDPRVELLVGGSYRRGADSSGDVDLVVTRRGTSSAADLVPFLDELLAVLTRRGILVATLASLHGRRPSTNGGGGGGGSKWHGCCVLPRPEGENSGAYKPVWRRIDFLLVPETEYGAALIYFTGNDIFNRSMRLLASRKGMRLNQRGLYREVMRGPRRVKVAEGELVEGRDERRIFEILGVKWREPWERWC